MKANVCKFAYFAGLQRGLAGEPCEFTIVTKDAGPGGLALAVHGPSKAEITCTDNGDGTCTVQYVPDEPGKPVVQFTFFISSFRFWHREPSSIL